LHKISSYYAPLQAAIKNFKSNCIFSSTLILFASIYCKKGIGTEKRECLFSIRKLFVSFHTKWESSRSARGKHLSNFNFCENCQKFVKISSDKIFFWSLNGKIILTLPSKQRKCFNGLEWIFFDKVIHILPEFSTLVTSPKKKVFCTF
jgi:hypothetical protein